MGGKSKPKMNVPRYYLSLHLGICQGPVDAVKAIWMGEKPAWEGRIQENQSLSLSKEGFYGGIKKEGGIGGNIDIMMGGSDQLAPQHLVARLGTGQPENTPGFRGVLSMLFRSSAGLVTSSSGKKISGTTGARGFYWGASNPYLRPVWVTVQRIPAKELNPATAAIARGSSSRPMSLYFELDDSGSMVGSRMANLKTSMNLVLDLLTDLLATGQRVDLGMVGFNRGRLERVNMTAADIQTFRDFLSTEISAGGVTPFDAPIQHAVNWFEATRQDAQLVYRLNFFVTDGAPSSDSHIPAAQIAADLLNRVIPVDMWGINIALSDTTYTEYLHNMEDPVPVISGNNPEDLAAIVASAIIDIWDANPAHIIYECLTDTDWGIGIEPDKIDTDSFVSASARLWGEQFGLFLQWQAPSTIETFVDMVLDHINGALFPHPATGKLTLRLLRDDLDVENLRIVNPDNAVMLNFSRKGWGETINEIVVTWTNPENEQEETIRAQDLANIAQQGAVISASRNYHGVRTAELATRLADRELRAASAPLCSCEVEVDREFWDVVPVDGMKVTWPEHGLNELVMRVMKVSYGTSDSSVIRLSLVEDVFALPLASYVPPETGEWESPDVPPVPVTVARLMPAPAYVVSNLGISLSEVQYPSTAVAPLAVNPTTADMAGYDVLVESSTPSGTLLWEETGETRGFVGRARLAEDLLPGAQSTDVALVNLTGLGPGPDSLLLIGPDSLPDAQLELALVTAVDETGRLTLLRGALDTVPQRWLADTRVTITQLQDWEPLPQEVADQQNLKLKFLTITSFGKLEEPEAPEFLGQAVSRATRPTRAAGLQVNGQGVEAWDGVLSADVLVITWRHRNRLLEDGALLSWDADSMPLEAGVTYRVESDAYDETDTVLQLLWFSENVGTVDQYSLDLTVNTPPAGWRSLRVRVVAERDSEDAWQSAEITVLPLLAPTNLAASYVAVLAPTNLSAEYLSLDDLYPTEGLSSQDELVDNEHQILFSGDAQETGDDGVEYQ